jgi:hypothetical protein
LRIGKMQSEFLFVEISHFAQVVAVGVKNSVARFQASLKPSSQALVSEV